VQGATEFLPVSSSGHLVLAERVLGFRRPGLALETGLHLGTLVAVILAYPGDVGGLFGGLGDLFRRRGGRRVETVLVLLAASLPAAMAGILLGDLVDRLFGSLVAVAIGWCVAGSALIASRRLPPGRRRLGDLGARDALLIGAVQALALVPGVSRSGATIVAGQWRGLAADEAARFSFLLSLPTVAGAVLLQALPLWRGGGGVGFGLWVGLPVAALAGFAAIRFCLRRLRGPGGLAPFGWYCLVLGALCLLRTSLSGG
jgi:undecaprenyl-diphosphatase